MTKGELIKALQESPFSDHAKVYITHMYDDESLILDPNCQEDIEPEYPVVVLDENELGIQVKETNFIIKRNEL